MAHFKSVRKPLNLAEDATSRAYQDRINQIVDDLDKTMGFDIFEEGADRTGWLINFHTTTVISDATSIRKSAVDFYFLDDDGGAFKVRYIYNPYFLIRCKSGKEHEVEEYLRRNFEGTIKDIEVVEKEDLRMPNNIVGAKCELLKLRFWHIQDLLTCRKDIQKVIQKNCVKDPKSGMKNLILSSRDLASNILDIREYDVPYHVRVAIDTDIRVGKWYKVSINEDIVSISELKNRITRADPVVLAFDIETTKLPLKFPDASIDSIIMISYMIDGEGFLITNRQIVSQDIEDFEYTPQPEFLGEIKVFNEPDERRVLVRFFDHIRETKPTVIATYNGDSFDWPFIDSRAKAYGLNLFEQIGFRKDSENEYKSMHCAHMDCFKWVQRDSYLPQGSQGLKVVTAAKLGYTPVELDPELMTPYAAERPQVLSEYSVSDAVATYYLYMKYVHPFIFSLCNILPLKPDEVLRKGTGTLCEMLLMVQAYKNRILLPHKHMEPLERFYEGHLIESETYVGGHVESLEAGVFRSDIPICFDIDRSAIDDLISQVDAALNFTITVELKEKLEDCQNLEQVKQEILLKLGALKARPTIEERPNIYHVDVASMYPNIMTTNRLQPDSMVSEKDCVMCDFNRPNKSCDRRLPWMWRGEFYPPKRDEYLMIESQSRREKFSIKSSNSNKAVEMRTYDELTDLERASLIKNRLIDYSKKVYHKLKDTKMVQREAIVCQRQNPFYVNTVRDFRDRRYEFKSLQKQWARKIQIIDKNNISELDEAKKMVVLYDSLQLAHKVILNSFYGYVMRKGSRWYSMEMAGVTCLTGATIIQLARSLVERLGRPLELDTDGIWCALPSSFPSEFTLNFKNGKKCSIAYPCVMLNHLVHDKFTNHQYQTLVDAKVHRYESTSDNSIFFEVDGPYRAMILPTSKEADKGIKKRYAVFNFDGSMSELKGFELKRRGELRLIKAFQNQIFSRFLEGESLEECYSAVAKVANGWLDVLETKGSCLQDQDLMDLISENRVMSKPLQDYGREKSTSICTARRLAEFLGDQMVRDKGLNCKFIISDRPYGTPVTDRAIPVAIFSAEPPVKAHFIRKWLKAPGLDNFDPRSIIDWTYYWDRLASTIQKIVTIPAALQKVSNPVPRIPHPPWLNKRIAENNDKFKQKSIKGFFNVVEKERVSVPLASNDIEDTSMEINGTKTSGLLKSKRALVIKRKIKDLDNQEMENGATSNFFSIDVTEDVIGSSPFKNYSHWLQQQKPLWWKQQEQLKLYRRAFGSLMGMRGGNSIEGRFLLQLRQNFSSGPWHILQVYGTRIPGQVGMFILSNGRTHRISVNVKRVLYLQSDIALQKDCVPRDCQLDACCCVFPSGNKNKYSYQLTLQESEYQKMQLDFSSILNQPYVRTIYGRDIDPTMRTIIDLGSVCTLDPKKRDTLVESLRTGFDLDWLCPKSKGSEAASGLTESYLQHADIKYVLLQYFEVNGHSFAVIFESKSEVAQVLHLNSQKNDESNTLSLTSEFESQIEHFPSFAEPLSNFVFKRNMKFLNFSFMNVEKFFNKLDSSLGAIQASKGSRTIYFVQSTRTEKLKQRLKTMRDICCIELASTSKVYPAVGWQRVLSKHIIKSYLRFPQMAEKLINLAQFSNIPLANLYDGNRYFMIDVLYVRELVKNKVVPWWSKSALPDFGEGKHESGQMERKSRFPVINKSGLYGKICVDLDITNFSINTILTANSILGLEDSALFNPEESNILQDVYCLPAISALTSMMKDWCAQAARNEEVAELLIQQTVAWLSQNTSYLYDPQLHYHIENMGSKSFKELIETLCNYGCEIIMANRNRIILVTPKYQVENVFAYASFIIKSVKQMPLFAYLDISVQDYWDCLAWFDEANSGGRIFKSLTDDRADYEFVGDWQLAENLPPILKDEFDEWVSQFLQSVCISKDELCSNGTYFTATTKNDYDSLFISQKALTGLLQPLYTRFTLLNKKYEQSISKGTVISDFAVQECPGRLCDKISPILQLIQDICLIFSLEKPESLEYLRLRRKLLGVVGVGEFDKNSQYSSPGVKLVLENVVCSYCSNVCFIDISQPLIKSVFGWQCVNCYHEFDRVYLEEKLVQQFIDSVSLFQLQDLKCLKCGRIRPNDLAQHCECSGHYGVSYDISLFHLKLKVFDQVAHFFDLNYLQSVLEPYATVS